MLLSDEFNFLSFGDALCSVFVFVSYSFYLLKKKWLG